MQMEIFKVAQNMKNVSLYCMSILYVIYIVTNLFVPSVADRTHLGDTHTDTSLLQEFRVTSISCPEPSHKVYQSFSLRSLSSRLSPILPY